MRKAIAVDKLTIGEILGQDIYDQDNKLLLRKGTVLLNALVEAFRQRDLRHVYIRAEAGSLSAVAAPGDGQVESRVMAAIDSIDEAALYQRFAAIYGRLGSEMRRARLRGQYNKMLPENLPGLALRLVSLAAALDAKQVMAFFFQAKQHYPDNHFEVHAANVCFLAVSMGNWMGLKEEEMKELALCSLLHDIGDTQIPAVLYEKSSRLTESEWNVIKTHPLLGARLVNKNKWSTAAIINGILRHHEKLDGSGYPSGLTDHGIPLFARIIATACSFDAMTADRPYRPAMSMFQALEVLKQHSFGELDARFTRMLYEEVILYFKGQQVELSNGERGIIVGLDHGSEGKQLLVQGEEDSYDLYRQGAPAIRCVLSGE